jgi:hypothetical protein
MAHHLIALNASSFRQSVNLAILSTKLPDLLIVHSEKT